MKKIIESLTTNFRQVIGVRDTPPEPLHDVLMGAGEKGENRSYRKFLVLAHPRSGSNMLVSGLQGNREILAFWEIFHEKRIYTEINSRQPDERWKQWRDRFPIDFLEKVVFRAYSDQTKAVGFKFFPEQIDALAQSKAVWDWLSKDKDIVVINLRRENLLAYFLSIKIASISDRWIDTSGEQNEVPVLAIDPEEAERHMDERIARQNAIRGLFTGHPFLDLTYEELCLDTAGCLVKIQSMLDVTPLDLKPFTIKQETRRLVESISNYDELARAWAGTRWETFLRS